MTDTFVIDSEHSPLGPSASDRWLECPGSVLLTKEMEDPESWFAAEGTAAHTLSEWVRRDNRSVHEYIGRKLKVRQYELTVDDEMAGAVAEFVSTVEQVPGFPLYEVRVHYDQWVPKGFGTLDDGRVRDGTVRITDFKYGKGVQVFAQDNSQLKLYAAGLYHDFRWLWQFDRFELSIFQPRLNHQDEFVINLKDLVEWMQYEVRPVAERALQPGAPLKAGTHCQFCPAKRTCKVRADFVLQTVAGEFGDLDAPRTLAVLSNDDIAKILPHLGIIKKWCGDIEAHAFTQIMHGQAVGDWKIVEGRSDRVYGVPEAEVVAKLEPLLGEALWTEPKLISPAQAETKLGGKNKKTAAILADIVHKPKGKPKLAPGSDPKPAMVVDVTAEFHNLDQEN